MSKINVNKNFTSSNQISAAYSCYAVKSTCRREYARGSKLTLQLGTARARRHRSRQTAQTSRLTCTWQAASVGRQDVSNVTHTSHHCHLVLQQCHVISIKTLYNYYPQPQSCLTIQQTGTLVFSWVKTCTNASKFYKLVTLQIEDCIFTMIFLDT